MIYTFDTRSPLITACLKRIFQILIKEVKPVDKDILEGIAGTKLVYLMAELAKECTVFWRRSRSDHT